MVHQEMRWEIRPNHFGNVGIFPEQAHCWQLIAEEIDADSVESDSFEVLNLFGYTGGSTLSAARAGAKVVHLDASKTSVSQARGNAELSGLAEAPVRWITEDAVRFVEREIRRQRCYHGLVLDPPTFGRGTRGETWKIDEHIGQLLELCAQILAPEPRLFLLTSHSPGYTPLVLENLLEPWLPDTGKMVSGEMVISELGSGRPLPSGAYACWRRGGARG